MAFPEDQLDPELCAVDRVRILVGDTDCFDVEMPEALYIYFLDNNNQEEVPAAIQALKALVSKYAKGMQEVVGDVEYDFRDRYEGYSKLLNKYLKDPSFGGMGTIQLYAGGLSYEEKINDYLNDDLMSTPFSVGSSSRRARRGYLTPFVKD